MKYLATFYQGRQEIQLTQCTRCKEVFSFAVLETLQGSFSEMVEAFHKGKCPEEAKREEFDFEELLHKMRWIEKRDNLQIWCRADDEKLMEMAKNELKTETKR